MSGVSVFKDLEQSNRDLVDLTGNEIDVLQLIQAAVAAIAGAKGALADLRVTPTGTVTVGGTLTTVTTVTTVATVTNLAQVGAVPAQQAVPAWQNNLVANTFTQNVDRGLGVARYA